MKVPDLYVGKRLFVGEGNPECLGRGEAEIRGSSFIEGPVEIGDAGSFSSVDATVMIGPDTNSESKNPDRSLFVKGDTVIEGDGRSGVELYVKGDAIFSVGTRGMLLSKRFEVADSLPKPFDMSHPSRGEGHRLRYACIEGPEVGVYFRGRITNKIEIELPSYWKDLVHINSISVQLQPIGAHQDIIVKRIDEKKIYLQAKGGMPIDCYYHVYAERKDCNALVVEYQGETYDDYPDKDYKDPQYANRVNTRTA
jgi:hypothetical protein